MKNIAAAFTLLLLLAGCQFQKPDYLKLIKSDALHQVMQQNDIFLVDVHTPRQNHIKGTDLVIPYDEIGKHLDQLPSDKTTAIYLYCEGGPMGNAASKTLHELGYQNIYNLEGGAKAWKKAGFSFE